jgi:putative addiction module component (TIGR02574 family)
MKAVTKPVIDISSLTPEERLDLIGDLWDSLDALPPTPSEEWEEEIRRRIDDVDSGRVRTVPGDEVFSRIEQRLRSRNAPPPALSEEQSEELARRVERVRQHGPTGLTISELRKQLLGS